MRIVRLNCRIGEIVELPESVRVVMACRNREEKTQKCLEALSQAAERAHLAITLTALDDGSSDATYEVLSKFVNERHAGSVELGSGDLYWAGGMRRVLRQPTNDRYLLLLNDDTILKPGSLNSMLSDLGSSVDIVVGRTEDSTGVRSYGGLVRCSSLKRLSLRPVNDHHGVRKYCQTFNCNAVLLRQSVYYSLGGFSRAYTHSLADIDFGLRAFGLGYVILESEETVGLCDRNSISGTWRDQTVCRRKRFREVLEVKGLPIREWFSFCARHGRLAAPLYFVWPYVRIMIGR